MNDVSCKEYVHDTRLTSHEGEQVWVYDLFIRENGKDILFETGTDYFDTMRECMNAAECRIRELEREDKFKRHLNTYTKARLDEMKSILPNDIRILLK